MTVPLETRAEVRTTAGTVATVAVPFLKTGMPTEVTGTTEEAGPVVILAVVGLTVEETGTVVVLRVEEAGTVVFLRGVVATAGTVAFLRGVVATNEEAEPVVLVMTGPTAVTVGGVSILLIMVQPVGQAVMVTHPGFVTVTTVFC